MAQLVKNPLAMQVDPDLIPGSGRVPGVGNTTRSSILSWKIAWTEESGRGYSAWGRKESDTTKTHTHTSEDKS